MCLFTVALHLIGGGNRLNFKNIEQKYTKEGKFTSEKTKNNKTKPRDK